LYDYATGHRLRLSGIGAKEKVTTLDPDNSRGRLNEVRILEITAVKASVCEKEAPCPPLHNQDSAL
jgi:hypothetical protein